MKTEGNNMTEAVKIITFIDIIFVILLMLSGTVGGIVGEVVYYLAFILPIAAGFYSSKGLQLKREEIAGVAEPDEKLLGFRREDAVRFIPLIAPTVMIVFLVSLLTSLLLSLVGISSPQVEEKGLATMLLIHAAVPALFEEALFRYIPMKLLLPYSRRSCVIYSALCFALIHCSFSQMPYAFVAGVLFMLADIAFGSVWPSVILHFANNAASVIMIKYCSGVGETLIFVSALAALTVVSLFFVYRKRSLYREILAGTLDKGEGFALTYAPMALIVITGYAAVANLFV